MSDDQDINPFPSIRVLKERHNIRARLPHKCHICGGEIAKGERYDYFFIRDEDSYPRRAFASHQHRFCPTLYEP